MIAKRISPIANANNLLAVTDGNRICADDAARLDYQSASFDLTNAAEDGLNAVNVTVPGGSAATVALTGAEIALDDATLDDQIIEAIGEVATDLGYEWFEGGIEIDRTTTDVVVITIRDSSLVWNWIGTASTAEKAFTSSTPY